MEVNIDKYLRFYLFKIFYCLGGINIFYVLDMVEYYFFILSYGDCLNVFNIVYVMMDGQFFSYFWIYNVVQYLKNFGVKVFVIGVGYVLIDELIDMVIDYEYVFIVDFFFKLLLI